MPRGIVPTLRRRPARSVPLPVSLRPPLAGPGLIRMGGAPRRAMSESVAPGGAAHARRRDGHLLPRRAESLAHDALLIGAEHHSRHSRQDDSHDSDDGLAIHANTLARTGAPAPIKPPASEPARESQKSFISTFSTRRSRSLQSRFASACSRARSSTRALTRSILSLSSSIAAIKSAPSQCGQGRPCGGRERHRAAGGEHTNRR